MSARYDLLTEFQNLIDKIGKEVAQESLLPVTEKMLQTWNQRIDTYEKQVSDRLESFAYSVSHVDQVLTESTELMSELKSLADQLAAGFASVVEESDIPGFLKTLTEEMENYQRLRVELADATNRLSEVAVNLHDYCGRFEDSLKAAHTRLADKMATELAEAKGIVKEFTDSLTSSNHQLCTVLAETGQQVVTASQEYNTKVYELEQNYQVINDKIEMVLKSLAQMSAILDSERKAIEELTAESQLLRRRTAMLTGLSLVSFLALGLTLIYFFLK